jgi:hypothetical protein
VDFQHAREVDVEVDVEVEFGGVEDIMPICLVEKQILLAVFRMLINVSVIGYISDC